MRMMIGAGNDRREEVHDPLDAARADQRRQNNIDQTGADDTAAGVRELFSLRQRNAGGIGQRQCLDSRETAEEREGRAQEHRRFPLGDKVEKQRADTGAEERYLYVQSCDDRDDNRCAKHRKDVLQAQNNRFRPAEFLRGIIDSSIGIGH